MPSQQQIDQHLLAIEINALRVAEITTLRRECEFWRQRCRVLEAVAESDGIRKRPAALSRRTVRVVAKMRKGPGSAAENVRTQRAGWIVICLFALRA